MSIFAAKCRTCPIRMGRIRRVQASLATSIRPASESDGTPFFLKQMQCDSGMLSWESPKCQSRFSLVGREILAGVNLGRPLLVLIKLARRMWLTSSEKNWTLPSAKDMFTPPPCRLRGDATENETSLTHGIPSTRASSAREHGRTISGTPSCLSLIHI